MQLDYGRLLLLEYHYSLVQCSNGREVNFGSFDFEIEKMGGEWPRKVLIFFYKGN